MMEMFFEVIMDWFEEYGIYDMDELIISVECDEVHAYSPDLDVCDVFAMVDGSPEWVRAE